MPSRLRIKFERVIDHVMALGNARQEIVQDDDRRRLLAALERVVARAGRDVLACLVMTNYLQLLAVGPGVGISDRDRADFR